jgi:hypothetical protein
VKVRIDGREYQIEFGGIDLDAHRELKRILDRPLRQAWAEVDWDDNAEVVRFLNDPDVILALAWLAKRQDDPAVTPRQVGRLTWDAFEYVADPDDKEAAESPPGEGSRPPKSSESESTGNGSGNHGSVTMSPVMIPASSGGPS